MKCTFANSFDFAVGKPLTIPYGRYPHKKSGTTQVIDRRSAVAFEAQISESKASGAPGLPIYAGHPDVPDLAARYPDKGAKGWIVGCEADDGACRLSVAWCDEPKAGAFIYFSPYFAGDDTGTNELLIDELRSVGLTNRPNCTRFRLPNEAVAEDTTQTERPQMNKLLTLLGLAATATEDEAAAKLQVLLDENAALKRTGEEQAAQVACATTAAESARTALENEREARIGLLLDCAIRDGRVTPATKPVWGARLRKDFANESLELSKECVGFKTRSALPNEAGDHTPASILARYDALPAGPEKAEFLRTHAVAINAARCSK
jgi:hypothetical protein